MTEVEAAVPAAAMSPVDEDGLFEVVVEERGASASFEVPTGWVREQHVVSDLQVEVLRRADGGDSERPALVTMHDIGMHAGLCFGGFLSYCRATDGCVELDTLSAQYHISAPGHGVDLGPVGAGVSYELCDLARGVVGVLERFGVTRAVGLGFGAGGAVLCEAATTAVGKFVGLVLISPVLLGAGLWERTWSGGEAMVAGGLGLGRRAKDRLLERWLCMETRDTNHDLVQTLEDELDRLCAGNVAGYMAAEVRRGDLSGTLRKPGIPRTLLVTGRESALRAHVNECFAHFDPARVTWLDVMHKGALVHEEAPERVAKALALYLQGMSV